MEFYFHSVMNSLKYPKSKSLSHCLTALFPIYQNKHWTIRRRDNRSIDSSSHHIILMIVGFYKVIRKTLDRLQMCRLTFHTEGICQGWTEDQSLSGQATAEGENCGYRPILDLHICLICHLIDI